MSRVQERHAEEAKQGPGEWPTCPCDGCTDGLSDAEIKQQTIYNAARLIKGHETDEERLDALYDFGFLVDTTVKG